MRTLVVILVSSLCFGCFVLDEIDSGQKEMNRYDGKGKADEAKAAETAKSQAPSPTERARQWWDKAHTFAPRADDAKSDIVSCRVGGAVRFTTQTDCQNSGGHVVGG